MTALERYEEVADDLARLGVTKAKLFGKPALMSGGKSFACLFKDGLACRLLAGTSGHAEALALTGGELFDPSGSGRAMKDWVVVPISAEDAWARFAELAQVALRG